MSFRYEQNLDQLAEGVTDLVYSLCDGNDLHDISDVVKSDSDTFLSALNQSPETLSVIQQLARLGLSEAVRRARLKFVCSDEPPQELDEN